MGFYLLVFVVALSTTIFGLARSQTAREKLHLQSVYDWSLRTIQSQLSSLDVFNYQEVLSNSELVQILENAVEEINQAEADEILSDLKEDIARSDSVEEIQGIRLRSENKPLTDDQKLNDETSINEENANNKKDKPSIKLPSAEMQDNMLAAINASLQKLSVAANSGRINGAQLYEILLKETLLHNKVMQVNEATANLTNGEGPSVSGATVIVEVDENEPQESDKPKMYFGESPMEYVPHQD